MKFNIDINDVKYLKINYIDENGNYIIVKSALKNLGEKEIVAVIKYENYFNIEIPQDIILSFACINGLYKTKTKLISYRIEESYIILYISTPDEMEYIQNREFFRIPVSYKCKYIVNKNDQLIACDAVISDISANGVSIMLPFRIYSEKDAEINITTDDKLIKTKVRYVRNEKIKDNYRLSFTYTEIATQDRDYISKICILKQLENKRNNKI